MRPSPTMPSCIGVSVATTSSHGRLQSIRVLRAGSRRPPRTKIEHAQRQPGLAGTPPSPRGRWAVHLRELFAAIGRAPSRSRRGDPRRSPKHRVTEETVGLCSALAADRRVAEWRDAMFRRGAREHDRGSPRAPRRPAHAPRAVTRRRRPDVVRDVHEVLDRMGSLADRVRSGDWRAHTGRPVRAVVNIGIGGSTSARRWRTTRCAFSDRGLTFRFVSNVDATDLLEAVRDLDPEETLMIVASKTFTTLETMTNAREPAAGCWTGSTGTRRRSRSTSSRSRRASMPSSPSASIPRTRSGSGTGSAAGTRWTRRSGSRR